MITRKIKMKPLAYVKGEDNLYLVQRCILRYSSINGSLGKKTTNPCETSI